MADFYCKYGNKNADLIASYRIGSKNIQIHRLSDFHFVLSRDRKIIHEYNNINNALSGFHFLISENGISLFNS